MPESKRRSVLKGFLTGLGDSLKMARLSAGMSREAAAAGLGVSVQTLYNWEVGRYAPNSQRLDQLCAAYGVRSNDLLRELYLRLAYREAPGPDRPWGVEPLALRELAKLPPEVQRNLVLKWIPVALEMGTSIAEARARYGADADAAGPEPQP